MKTAMGDRGMTFIRIKVKHLIMILASALLVVLAAIYLQGSLLYLLGRVSEGAGDAERAGVFYDRAAEEFPGSAGSLAAAESKLELMFREKDFGYLRKLKLTGSTTMLNGAYIGGDSVDAINRQYEGIAKYAARDDGFARYTIYVAMANYFGGYGEKAVGLLEAVKYIKNSDLEQMRRLNLSAMLMGLGDMEKGYGMIKDGLERTDKYSGVRNALYRYCCFMTGKPELFKNMERQRDIWYEQTKDLKDTLLKPLLDINNTISGYTELAGLKDKQNRTGNVFYGRVTDEGRPVAYALVSLKDTSMRGVESSQMGVGDGVKSYAVTDADGYYRMENVPDGVYGMGISLEWQRVQGKAWLMYKNYDLKFEGGSSIEKNVSFFSPKNMVSVYDAGGGRLEFRIKLPEGATYYTIAMGELRDVGDNMLIANNTFNSERLKASDYILDIGEERRRGMLTGTSYGTDGLDPHDLMEPFYHTGDYSYNITFYDNRDGIMFDSSGIYPNRQSNLIHVDGSEWSEADRLLLDKKYDEAVKLYEATIDEPEEGLHALKVLAKLYLNGWVYNAKTYELENKDTQKAKKYLTMLTEKIADNSQINAALARLYMEEKDYSKAISILEKNTGDTFGTRQIARVYGYMDSFSKAVEYYNKFYDTTGQGADRLLMLYLLQGRTEKLLDMAGMYSDNGTYYADYTSLIREYLKMDTSGYDGFFSLVRQDKPDMAAKLLENHSDDLTLLYRGLLLLQEDIPGYVEREKIYSAIYESVKDKTIKQLMKYFGKEGINSGFGDYP